MKLSCKIGYELKELCTRLKRRVYMDHVKLHCILQNHVNAKVNTIFSENHFQSLFLNLLAIILHI